MLYMAARVLNVTPAAISVRKPTADEIRDLTRHSGTDATAHRGRQTSATTASRRSTGAVRGTSGVDSGLRTRRCDSHADTRFVARKGSGTWTARRRAAWYSDDADAKGPKNSSAPQSGRRARRAAPSPASRARK
jgi:hypothetical protein